MQARRLEKSIKFKEEHFFESFWLQIGIRLILSAVCNKCPLEHTAAWCSWQSDHCIVMSGIVLKQFHKLAAEKTWMFRVESFRLKGPRNQSSFGVVGMLPKQVVHQKSFGFLEYNH